MSAPVKYEKLWFVCESVIKEESTASMSWTEDALVFVVTWDLCAENPCFQEMKVYVLWMLLDALESWEV